MLRNITIMPVLSKTANCKGCGSTLHTRGACPNHPCPCCAVHHERGILDCPIYIAAKRKVEVAAAAADAGKKKIAAGIAKEKRAAASEAKKSKAAADAARLEKDMQLFNRLSAAGRVVQCNRSMYNKKNWGMTSNWICPVCRSTADFCI